MASAAVVSATVHRSSVPESISIRQLRRAGISCGPVQVGPDLGQCLPESVNYDRGSQLQGLAARQIRQWTDISEKHVDIITSYNSFNVLMSSKDVKII